MLTQETKPLWLVRPRLDASQYREKLIGSVVKYPDLPTERYIPCPSSSPHEQQRTRLPKDIVPSLDPTPVTIRNMRFWTRRIRDSRVHASVREILEGFAGREHGSAEEKMATVARVWHIERPGEMFEALLGDEGYLGELLALLGSSAHKQAYFVTDVVSLVNMRVRDMAEQGKTAGAAMGVLVSPVVDMSGAQHLTSAGWEIHALAARGLEACYEEETIVFMGYRLIRLEKVAGARAKLKRMLRRLPARRGRGKAKAEGFTVRDGFDYWPEMAERPVEGDAEGMFLAAGTPTGARFEGVGEEEEEWEGIVRELGFDVEVVG